MKKLVFVLIALHTYLHVQAQQSTDLGIRAGTSLATWTGLIFDNGQDIQRRVGLFAGAYVNNHFSEALSLEAGLYITSKGFTMTGSINDPSVAVSGTVENISTYLDVPLLLRIYVVDGFHLHGGPQLSYLLANKVNGEITINGTAGSENTDTSEYIEDLDFAVVLGLGYDFPFGLNINLDFDFGIAEVLAVPPYAFWTEAKNRVIKVSLGYSFGKK